MAKLTGGIFGKLAGSAGGATFSQWKGIQTVKEKVAKVTNPRSSGQVAQRSKFSNAVQFARLLLTLVVKPLWDRFAVRQSGFNAFVAVNLDLFASGYPSSPGNLRISQGRLTAINPTAIDPAAGSSDIMVEWSTDLPDDYSADSDLVYIVAAQRGLNLFGISSGEAVRSAGAQHVTIPFNWGEAGTEYDVWIAFKRADGTMVSGTGYVTGTVV